MNGDVSQWIIEERFEIWETIWRSCSKSERQYGADIMPIITENCQWITQMGPKHAYRCFDTDIWNCFRFTESGITRCKHACLMSCCSEWSYIVNSFKLFSPRGFLRCLFMIPLEELPENTHIRLRMMNQSLENRLHITSKCEKLITLVVVYILSLSLNCTTFSIHSSTTSQLGGFLTNANLNAQV